MFEIRWLTVISPFSSRIERRHQNVADTAHIQRYLKYTCYLSLPFSFQLLSQKASKKRTAARITGKKTALFETLAGCEDDKGDARVVNEEMMRRVSEGCEAARKGEEKSGPL